MHICGQRILLASLIVVLQAVYACGPSTEMAYVDALSRSFSVTYVLDPAPTGSLPDSIIICVSGPDVDRPTVSKHLDQFGGDEGGQANGFLMENDDWYIMEIDDLDELYPATREHLLSEDLLEATSECLGNQEDETLLMMQVPAV